MIEATSRREHGTEVAQQHNESMCVGTERKCYTSTARAQAHLVQRITAIRLLGGTRVGASYSTLRHLSNYDLLPINLNKPCTMRGADYFPIPGSRPVRGASTAVVLCLVIYDHQGRHAVRMGCRGSGTRRRKTHERRGQRRRLPRR